MSERNIELLEKTMQYIKDHPEKHKQDVFIRDTNECGTAACFCGWAAMLSGYTARDIIRASHITQLGADLLGIEFAEACRMFRTSNSREMLELMVKDLVNGDEMRDWTDYYKEAHHA